MKKSMMGIAALLLLTACGARVDLGAAGQGEHGTRATCLDALHEGGAPAGGQALDAYEALVECACSGACADACADEICSGEPTAFEQGTDTSCTRCMIDRDACFMEYMRCGNPPGDGG